ncbi:succinyl-diaminopimelate desuccinylase [Mycoplana sp. BE70]|uniref:M20 family metallopeptidase n=1 Tax=Mycoplana sp. BE70 TaxID=2817775 RepID=UPI0028627A01|nr:M20/M25/M40 family metallo-hydrolase [Mycoplana sp. BE70]MDR6755135.1 succinyl-diaminopimelate desuccinylase [Mycoplana sp. BE70]
MTIPTNGAETAKQFSETNRERLVDLCAQLVAARSPQPIGDTTAPVAVVKAFLQENGLEPRIVAATGNKPNLVCTFDGAYPGPHLVLNGHLDTLNPGDEAAWSVPVFEMGRNAGRLTGLGIGNMKAGSAALAMAFVGLHRYRSMLAGRATLTLVADEVVFGPDGAAFLLADDPGLTGDFLINAEGPGHMGLAVAEKGLLWVSIEAQAPAGQGMLTGLGTSATARLARLLTAIDAWNEERVAPPKDMEILGEGAGPHDLRLSVNVGTLQGGSFVSQVATQAVAEVDFRVPPGMTIEEVEARLQAQAEAIGGIVVRRIKGWNPSWTPIDHPLCRAMLEASAAIRGQPGKPVVRLPASDAVRWRARGVGAVCYGPQAELASGLDDYVFENDVVDCVGVYMAAALTICAAPGNQTLE